MDEINEVANEVLKNAPGKVLCLYGDMGVGKTTLVKALVKELGAVDMANSPTSDAWLFIEWPEKISSLLPEDAVRVFLHFIEETTRSIELNVS